MLLGSGLLLARPITKCSWPFAAIRSVINRSAAKMAIFEFIEVFYNRQRSHQTLDYQTPLTVEQEYRLVA